MKSTSLVARLLLGLIFIVFGLNGFLHFLPTGPIPGPAGQFFAVVSETHFITVVFAFQLLCGILLVLDQFVTFALTVLAAIIVNIVLFHASMALAGLPLALVVVVLWLLAAYPLRARFFALLARK